MRMRHLFPIAGVILGAALLAPTVTAAAEPKLPKPRSTVVKPNAGVGALRLDHRVRPWPKGWKKPFKCTTIQGVRGCIWTTREDALPPRGQTGIKGPYVIAMGRKRLEGVVISSGGQDLDSRPLRKWRTRKGIGFTSTLQEFIAAYPTATQHPTTGSYRITKRGYITTFIFQNEVLNTIEMFPCTPTDGC